MGKRLQMTNTMSEQCLPHSTAMYAAAWPVLIAPLDTAGKVKVSGRGYRKILQSRNQITLVLIEEYRL